ncbi:MAG: hypothetical protein LBB23_01240 [Rickettsiales bacterium]|nr:hypothetical protein [Rickettsiales bacterium]
MRLTSTNHPVRLRFATARHPAIIGGEFLLTTTPALRATPSPAKGTFILCRLRRPPISPIPASRKPTTSASLCSLGRGNPAAGMTKKKRRGIYIWRDPGVKPRDDIINLRGIYMAINF